MIHESLYTSKEETLLPDICMMRSRGFIRSEGVRRRRRGRRKMTIAATATRGRDRRGRGPHPWMTPPKTTRSTAPSPLEVLLLLTSKLPRTTMTKRGAWWECFSSGYEQWDTWRT